MMRNVCRRICGLIPRVSNVLTSSSATYCDGFNNDRAFNDEPPLFVTDNVFVNSCQLVGNVGTDPEELGTDKLVVTFPLVTVNYFRFQGTGETREFKHWHKILVAGVKRREQVLRELDKGDKIYVDGHIRLTKRPTGHNGIYIFAERILKIHGKRRIGARRVVSNLSVDGFLEEFEQEEESVSEF